MPSTGSRSASGSGTGDGQGHEAFSSLVDIAAKQPALPIPSANTPSTTVHEGLGKTMADHLAEPHRFQMRQQQQRLQMYQQQQQQQQQQRLVTNAALTTASNTVPTSTTAQAQTQANGSLTAASLIDAIITHQINLTTTGAHGDGTAGGVNPACGSISGPSRVVELQRPSDRLFQSFNRALHDANIPRVQSPSSASASAAVVTQPHLQPLNVAVDDEATSQTQSQSHPSHLKQRQIIRIANISSSQTQKYEPVSPPEAVTPAISTASVAVPYWSGAASVSVASNTVPISSAQSHISAFDYVKNRIAEVMRTEDDAVASTAQTQSFGATSGSIDVALPEDTDHKNDVNNTGDRSSETNSDASSAGVTTTTGITTASTTASVTLSSTSPTASTTTMTTPTAAATIATISVTTKNC